MITLVLCTARQQPMFDWMADSLTRNLNENKNVDCELIVVDKLLWPQQDAPFGEAFEIVRDRREQLDDAVKGRFAYRHVPPKPTPWQGPYRKTLRDYFALSNARNTAIALARGQHIVHFDDCTVLGDQWLYWHVQAANRRIAACGAFTSWNTAKVENGLVIGGELHPGQDSRKSGMGDGEAFRRAPGGWMWGLNISYPIERALQVNGYDEKYDGQGGSEDCDFGVRLERVGCQIVYFKNCEIHQILETHEAVCGFESTTFKPNQHPVKQKELMLADGRLHYANEFLIQELGANPTQVWANGNEVNLAMIRPHVLIDGMEAFPDEFKVELDWRDGQPLKEME